MGSTLTALLRRAGGSLLGGLLSKFLVLFDSGLNNFIYIML